MSNARKLADNLPTDGQLGNRNIIINGSCSVAQRGTQSTTTNGFSWDWILFVPKNNIKKIEKSKKTILFEFW